MKKKYILFWSALLLICSWSLWQSQFLKTEYSLEQFYPQQHELLRNHDHIRKTFRLNENSPYLFIITLKNGARFFESAPVQNLRQLSETLRQRADVKKVISLTEIEGASGKDDEMIIGNIFDRSPATHWRSDLLKNPLIFPGLLTEDLTSTLLVIESRSKSEQELKNFVQAMETLIRKSFPEATIQKAGVPLLQGRLSEIIKKELFIFFLSGLIVFCLIFSFFFSHWSAVAVAMLALLVTNIFSLASISALGVPMNAILVTLPIIVSVSVMSLLIHTLHQWSLQGQSHGTYEERFLKGVDILKEMILPNLLGVLTTAIGFIALFPSPIPIISEYGLIVAVTMVGVSMLGQIFLAAFLPLVRPQMRHWLQGDAAWILIPLRHYRIVFFGFLTFLMLSILMVSSLNFSIRLFDDLPDNDPIQKASQEIDHHYGGLLGYDILAESINAGFWKQPQNLKRLIKLRKALRKINGMGTVLTPADFFTEEALRDEGQIAETFFLFSMAEKNPLNSFMTDDGKKIRLSLKLKDLPATQVKATRAQVQEIFRSHFPELNFSEGGMAYYAHAINEEVSRNLIFDFWKPLLFIGVFLIFIFGSLKWALISCLPNFIPPAALLLIMSTTQIAIKPGIALIFSIALGLAFNNTLYVLNRLKKTRSLKETLTAEALPCLFESSIMLIGFSLLFISDFSMNQNFGGFMLLAILAGTAADLIFLPAFLRMFPSSYRKSRKKAASFSYVTVTFLFMALTVCAQAKPDAKDVLKKSQLLLDARDDKASVEMRIIEDNGEIKERKLSLKTLRENGFSVLARIEAPADIKNMAFLGLVDTEGNEKQWIYLPSSGKVKRLVTGKTKAGLLGSELGPEDLNSQVIKSSFVKLLKEDKNHYWIQLIPEKDSSEYSKVITKISRVNHLPKETLYYVKDQLKKTVSFKDYEKFGKIFRAKLIDVKNHFNGRGTEIRLRSIKVNTGLMEDDFSQSSLKD